MTVEALAREIVHHSQTVEHEAAHAAAALVLGFDLVEVRVDRPEPETSGRINVRGGLLRPREFAQVILAGPLLDPGKPTPRWPLEGAPDDSDRGLLKQITRHLKFERKDWDDLVLDTWQLTARPEFCLAESVFASLLEQWPLIKGELLSVVVNTINHTEQRKRDAP